MIASPPSGFPIRTRLDLRALLKHRLRLVRIRTMIKNGLHAIALNQRLALGPSLWSRRGLARLHALVLLPHTARRRDDSLELLQWLDRRIDELDVHVAAVVSADPNARRLMTHPGVGPLTALATVLVLGPVTRFPNSKHVVSYVGLAPAINASADKYRLGHISKQGSALLRWVLAKPPRWRREPIASSTALTSPSSGGAGGPRPKSPSPAACWFVFT
jgi:transposase